MFPKTRLFIFFQSCTLVKWNTCVVISNFTGIIYLGFLGCSDQWWTSECLKEREGWKARSQCWTSGALIFAPSEIWFKVFYSIRLWREKRPKKAVWYARITEYFWLGSPLQAREQSIVHSKKQEVTLNNFINDLHDGVASANLQKTQNKEEWLIHQEESQQDRRVIESENGLGCKGPLKLT